MGPLHGLCSFRPDAWDVARCVKKAESECAFMGPDSASLAQQVLGIMRGGKACSRLLADVGRLLCLLVQDKLVHVSDHKCVV